MYVWYRHCLWALLLLGTTAVSRAADVRFSRDIRPILSDACFRCHGADDQNRQAELRLDRREGLFKKRDGRTIVVPKQAERSELIRRVASAASDQRMPPPDADRQLTANEVDLLRTWIEQGADWSEHWSFVPPRNPSLPQPGSLNLGHVSPNWPRTPIDLFILRRLAEAGLRPSREADRAALARRAALTLTGLSPKPDELSIYLADKSPDAYQRFVDRLLDSPRYGEHAALVWLDLARYADTDGYQDDQPRVMWRWRDWLIDALNAGMPFDQFTIELLAGDLLPEATDWQRLATGFHRNHRTNGEGGSIAEEFRVEYVVDCVETTSTVWLGVTIGCCRCHDHKYDPFSQRDFYRLFALFNNTPEKGVYRGNDSPPLIKVPTVEQQRQLDLLNHRIAAAAGDAERRKTLEVARKKLWDQVASTMTMSEDQPRDTFVLVRGQYDRPGEKVSAGVVEELAKLPANAPANRLGLARWLVSRQNPLVARVAVNRIWSMHFGVGLVATPEDFGVQGEAPSHPKLLDWLATRFMESGWDVKGLHRLIVTSAVYRQASDVKPREFSVDPKSRWLWRYPRWRLKGEQIRDRALHVSGLLVERLGGPSVKPYQPQGLWEEIAGGSTSAYKGGYQRDHGAGLYRRSLYTFWRRTIPPPGMTTFDAPSRETCTARRANTNTPLQSLALLNDVTYLEAARELGERMMSKASTPEAQLEAGFQIALSRQSTAEEREILLPAYERRVHGFRRNTKSAMALTRIGETKADPSLDVAELAAWMSIANTILNLDEFVVVE